MVSTVERRHRVLEDHGDAVAAQSAHGLRVELQEIGAGKRNAAALDPRIGRHEAEDRLDQARFAAAAFPDDADDLARRHLQGDIAERVQRPALGAIGEIEMLDQECWRAHHRLPERLGSKVSRSASPRKVKPRVVMMMGSPPAMTGQGDSRI